jgi:hypothetical protein
MVLLDYYQSMIIALVYGGTKDFELESTRNIALDVIRRFNVKFRRQYGQMVIACDSKNNWRKDYFPFYKAGRAKAKASDSINWTKLYDQIHTIRDEIDQFMPYPVMHLERTEADDIIAVLTKKNFEDGKQTLIISNDKDFGQLHSQLTKQFDPGKHKYIEAPVSSLSLKEHILKGDMADGIPNVLNNDDCMVNKNRQKPLRQTKLEELLNSNIEETEYHRNWIRNKALIDFNEIPPNIKDAILKQYEEKSQKRVNPYAYLAKASRQFIEQLDNF